MVGKIAAWFRERKAIKFKEKRDKEVRCLLKREMMNKVLRILESIPPETMEAIGDGNRRFDSLDGRYEIFFYKSYREATPSRIAVIEYDNFRPIDACGCDINDKSVKHDDIRKKLIDYWIKANSLREERIEMSKIIDMKEFINRK